MKKRWFVVILTIGLLLHVLPLSVLALSPDPTITDSDGTLLGWSDLSTVPYSLDVHRNSSSLSWMRTTMKKQRMTCPQGIPPPKLLTRDRVTMTLRMRTAMKQRMTCPQESHPQNS